MRRTQISLEEKQYVFLTQESRRRGISLSELIRQFISEHLQQRSPSEDPVDKLCGMAEGPGGAIGREHDRFLYGKEEQ
ncbi:MAG: CopG family transcriptional regulator [Gammaproteobacteria bacterium]